MKDGQFYTGCTRDLKRRITEHNTSKYFPMKSRTPFKLIYYEVSISSKDAFAREKYLKSGMGKRYINNRLKHYLNHNF